MKTLILLTFLFLVSCMAKKERNVIKEIKITKRITEQVKVNDTLFVNGKFTIPSGVIELEVSLRSKPDSKGDRKTLASLPHGHPVIFIDSTHWPQFGDISKYPLNKRRHLWDYQVKTSLKNKNYSGWIKATRFLPKLREP